MNRVTSSEKGAAASRPVGVPRARRWSVAVASAGAVTTLVALMAVPATASPPARTHGFRQIDLVSDRPGVARLTDPDLVNAWGLSASPGTDAAPGSPLWVSDNGTDKTTLYSRPAPRTVSKVLAVGVTSGAPTGGAGRTKPQPKTI